MGRVTAIAFLVLILLFPPLSARADEVVPPIVLKSDGSHVTDKTDVDPSMHIAAPGCAPAGTARDGPPAPPPVVITIVTEAPPPPPAENPVGGAGASIDRAQAYLRTERLLETAPPSNGTGNVILVIPSSGAAAPGGADAEIGQTERMRVLDKFDYGNGGRAKVLIAP